MRAILRRNRGQRGGAGEAPYRETQAVYLTVPDSAESYSIKALDTNAGGGGPNPARFVLLRDRVRGNTETLSYSADMSGALAALPEVDFSVAGLSSAGLGTVSIPAGSRGAIITADPIYGQFSAVSKVIRLLADATKPIFADAVAEAVLQPGPAVSEVKFITFQPATKPNDYSDNRALVPVEGTADLGIFPEKKDPNDRFSSTRKRVTLRAKLDQAKENVDVYFLVYDADDPSSANAPVDGATDSQGRQTGFDNRGGDPDKILSAKTDKNGVALVAFEVKPQPGNNYRAFSSTVQKDVKNLLLEARDGYAALPAGVQKTGLLTVARTLHIERDSMDAPPATERFTGAKKDNPDDDVQFDPEIKPADLDTMYSHYKRAFIDVVDDLQKFNPKKNGNWV